MMGIFRRDPVCPRHNRAYPKGSTCFHCRQDARKPTLPTPVRTARAEASIPQCPRCGKKIRGGYCPTAGCL